MEQEKAELEILRRIGALTKEREMYREKCNKNPNEEDSRSFDICEAEIWGLKYALKVIRQVECHWCGKKIPSSGEAFISTFFKDEVRHCCRKDECVEKELGKEKRQEVE